MSRRMAVMARRSRMAAVTVASPRYLPHALSLMFEVIAVEPRWCRRSIRLNSMCAAVGA